jgi:hypothetical protein
VGKFSFWLILHKSVINLLNCLSHWEFYVAIRQYQRVTWRVQIKKNFCNFFHGQVWWHHENTAWSEVVERSELVYPWMGNLITRLTWLFYWVEYFRNYSRCTLPGAGALFLSNISEPDLSFFESKLFWALKVRSTVANLSQTCRWSSLWNWTEFKLCKLAGRTNR